MLKVLSTVADSGISTISARYSSEKPSASPKPGSTLAGLRRRAAEENGEDRLIGATDQNGRETAAGMQMNRLWRARLMNKTNICACASSF